MSSPQTLKALSNERRVADELITRGWALVDHNVRIWRVQVDLLMRSPQGVLHIIEVKSQTGAHMAHLPRRQFQRLRRVAGFLSEFEPVEMILALVGAEIELLPVDALTGF